MVEHENSGKKGETSTVAPEQRILWVDMTGNRSDQPPHVERRLPESIIKAYNLKHNPPESH